MPSRDVAAESAGASKSASDVPFEIWLGQILQKRSTVEVLRQWEKTSGIELTLEEFRTEVGKLGYSGQSAGIDNFFHMMVSNEPGKAKRYTVFLVEVKENMKLCVEKAQAYERERKRVSKTRELEKKREAAISFLEDRKRHFSALYEDAAAVRDHPISETSISLQLGARFEKAATLHDIQKMWDRHNDSRVSKPEFRERVTKLLGVKISSFHNGQRELDALFDAWDMDKNGGLELVEMVPGLSALRLKSREVKAKEKFKVDRLGVYKMKRDQAVAALHANMYAQQAEDELNKRKESTPLNVMLGSQINHKNVAEMMRAWDRSGDGIVSMAEFKSGLLLQGIEYDDEEIERVFGMIDDSGTGNVGTEELRGKIKQMQGAAAPYFKSLKEETARVADAKKRAQQLLQAERSRKEEEEEEEKRLQAEEEHQRQQRMAQEQEAIARAEERRHAAHEAAMEKKRAEKAAFDERVAAKRLGRIKAGVFTSAKKGGPNGGSEESLLATRRSSMSNPTPRPSSARLRERRSKSSQVAVSTSAYPLRTGLEQFQQETQRSKARRQPQWQQVACPKPLLLRAEPELDSVIVGDLAPGSVLQVLEVRTLEDGTRRVRSSKGWCTAVSKDGNFYLSDVVRPDFSTIWPTALVPKRRIL